MIGGIAVVLHGHWKSTRHIDLLVEAPQPQVVEVLQSIGFALDPERRELVRDGLPVHLVTPDLVDIEEPTPIELEGVATVSLPDLLTMKLRSGSKNLL